jgi:error-prone DNA polymerase
MLNSQPMGFYPPSQLIQDAVRHGVQVLPPDVSHSDWDTARSGSDSNSAWCTPRRAPGPAPGGQPERRGRRSALKPHAPQAPFTSTEDLSLRAQLDVRDLNALAAGDALKSLSGHRRQQVWDAAARHRAPACCAARR